MAYRFFTTERRKFIVADTPGHEQYTRNMVTGASTADVAVILVDARKGVLTQTRRHTLHRRRCSASSTSCSPSTSWTWSATTRRCSTASWPDYREFAAGLGLTDITAIPISALRGDNVVEPSANTPWYDGPPLLEYLETVEVDQDAVERSVPAAGADWSSGPTSTSAATRASSPAGRCARATRCGCCRPARRPRWSGSSPSTATCRAAEAGQSVDAHPRPGDRRQPRRPDRRGGRPGRRGRPVRGPPRLDARRAAAAGPPVPDQAGQLDRRLHRHPHQVRHQREHPGADARQHAGASTRSRSRTSPPTGGCRSTRTRRTATPAGSCSSTG